MLGKPVRRPAILDRDLAEELLEAARADDPWQTVLGKTMCTDDFYEGGDSPGRCICTLLFFFTYSIHELKMGPDWSS